VQHTGVVIFWSRRSRIVQPSQIQGKRRRERVRVRDDCRINQGPIDVKQIPLRRIVAHGDEVMRLPVCNRWSFERNVIPCSVSQLESRPALYEPASQPPMEEPAFRTPNHHFVVVVRRADARLRATLHPELDRKTRVRPPIELGTGGNVYAGRTPVELLSSVDLTGYGRRAVSRG